MDVGEALSIIKIGFQQDFIESKHFLDQCKDRNLNVNSVTLLYAVSIINPTIPPIINNINNRNFMFSTLCYILGMGFLLTRFVLSLDTFQLLHTFHDD